MRALIIVMMRKHSYNYYHFGAVKLSVVSVWIICACMDVGAKHRCVNAYDAAGVQMREYMDACMNECEEWLADCQH